MLLLSFYLVVVVVVVVPVVVPVVVLIVVARGRSSNNIHSGSQVIFTSPFKNFWLTLYLNYAR